MSSKAWASLESASTNSCTGGEHSLESEAFVGLPLLMLCAVGSYICQLHMTSPGSSDSFLEHHVTSRDCGLTLTCHAITHAKTSQCWWTPLTQVCIIIAHRRRWYTGIQHDIGGLNYIKRRNSTCYICMNIHLCNDLHFWLNCCLFSKHCYSRSTVCLDACIFPIDE